MLKIRLSRTGKKNQPSFRVVVQEHTSPIKGKFVENLGYYRPSDDPKVFEVDVERVKHWISMGAQPSDTVAVLLKRGGLEGMEQYIGERKRSRKKKKEVEEKAPVAAAEATPEEAPAAPEAPEEIQTPEAPAEETPAEAPAGAAAEPTKETSPAEEDKPDEESIKDSPAE